MTFRYHEKDFLKVEHHRALHLTLTLKKKIKNKCQNWKKHFFKKHFFDLFWIQNKSL